MVRTDVRDIVCAEVDDTGGAEVRDSLGAAVSVFRPVCDDGGAEVDGFVHVGYSDGAEAGDTVDAYAGAMSSRK